MGGHGRDDVRRVPTGKHTIDETLEIGDRVVLRGSFSGTHAGEFMGMPPTGTQITVTFMNIDRFAGDKLIEHRVEVDMAGLGTSSSARSRPRLRPSLDSSRRGGAWRVVEREELSS